MQRTQRAGYVRLSGLFKPRLACEVVFGRSSYTQHAELCTTPTYNDIILLCGFAKR